MEKDVLRKLQMNDREEAVCFLKRLLTEEPTPCPNCGNMLEHLHKKEKKSNCDWKCSSCGTVYKVIRLLDELNEQ